MATISGIPSSSPKHGHPITPTDKVQRRPHVRSTPYIPPHRRSDQVPTFATPSPSHENDRAIGSMAPLAGSLEPRSTASGSPNDPLSTTLFREKPRSASTSGSVSPQPDDSMAGLAGSLAASTNSSRPQSPDPTQNSDHQSPKGPLAQDFTQTPVSPVDPTQHENVDEKTLSLPSLFERIKNCIPFDTVKKTNGWLDYALHLEARFRHNVDLYMSTKWPQKSLGHKTTYFILNPLMTACDAVFNTALLVIKIASTPLIAIGKLFQKILTLGKDVEMKKTILNISSGISSQFLSAVNAIGWVFVHAIGIGFVLNWKGATSPELKG